MPDKITTLKLVDNTDVFPNIKEENVPNTIMRIADLSKYLNQLKSINITGDIDSTTITSDIATFTTADISTLNVSGVSHYEGEATFGSNVHVDGNLVVYGIDNIFDKDGRKIVNTGSFDPTSDNPAGQKSTEFHELQRQVRDRISSLRGRGNANFLFTLIDFGDYDFGDIIYFDPSMYYGITEISSLGSAVSIFVASNIRRITYSPILDQIFSYAKDMRECFCHNDRLTFIGEFSISNCTNLFGAFTNDNNLKTIKLKNIPVSFDISSSTRFEESDLVEIISNLVDLTGKTAQTLTMGATNLAKLTDAEKAVAVNKNWVLA